MNPPTDGSNNLFWGVSDSVHMNYILLYCAIMCEFLVGPRNSSCLAEPTVPVLHSKNCSRWMSTEGRAGGDPQGGRP